MGPWETNFIVIHKTPPTINQANIGQKNKQTKWTQSITVQTCIGPTTQQNYALESINTTEVTAQKWKYHLYNP